MLHKALAFTAQFALPQMIESKNPTEEKAKLEKEAIAFLRETLA